jgi:uncharacterized protein (DUF433 family)
MRARVNGIDGRRSRSKPIRRLSAGMAFAASLVPRYDDSSIAKSTKRGLHMAHARIAADPKMMMGKPCIRGTRITVELILRKLGAGRSFADVLEAYPQLTGDDLRAALAFAADYLQHETVLAAE